MNLDDQPDESPAKPVKPSLARLIERRTWAIWSYVRDHQHSLDSDRACAMIRQGLEEAVAEVQRENDSLKAQVRALKQRVKGLKEAAVVSK